MQNSFKNRTCPQCGSTDLAHYAMWITGTIPAGVEGEILCRSCLYWELLLTTQHAENVFDVDMWVVLEAGQGTYRNDADKARVTLYQDPQRDSYLRYS